MIRVLDENLINKIAAGEVVERPANVVKELVENAVDAGAKAIAVEIRGGGASLIRVTDDGCGIAPNELRTAFLRHATSKISDLHSLENVLTMGFRGEALSSIAGVSRVKVLTKTANLDTGRVIEIEGGAVLNEHEAGCANGVDFVVRDLFFNVPARKKFLKSAAAETAVIAETLGKIAVSRSDISFQFKNNGTQQFRTVGDSNAKMAFAAAFGAENASALVEFRQDCVENGMSIFGVLGKPDITRSNRKLCMFFLNGRLVKSDIMQNAVEEAYKSRMLLGRFPVFALNLNVSPAFTDVNVHPAKLFVKFEDDERVFNFVKNAVAETLKEICGAARPEPVLEKKPKIVPPMDVYAANTGTFDEMVLASKIVENSDENFDVTPFLYAAEDNSVEYDTSAEKAGLADITYISFNSNFDEIGRDTAKPVEFKEVVHAPPKPFFTNYLIIGRAFSTYWFAECDGSVFIVDQHAAHERILFEELSEKVKKRDSVAQKLVVPIPLELSPEEKAVIYDNMENLETIGYEIESLGTNLYALRSVPFIFGTNTDFSFINDVLTALSSKFDKNVVPFDKIALASCKAAVKANDKLSDAEARELIKRLLKTENPFNCPHGRPTIVELKKTDIEKMFKRT